MARFSARGSPAVGRDRQRSTTVPRLWKMGAPMDAAADHRHFLSRAAQLLSSSPDFDDALRQTMAAALPTLGDFGFFDVVDGDDVRRTARAHEDDELESLLQTTRWVRQQRDDGIKL